MRLQSSSSSSDVKEMRKFSEWILSIENGEAGKPNDSEEKVEISDDMLIRNSEDFFAELVKFAYLDILMNISKILTPILQSVEFVNNYLMSLISDEEKEYLSSDSMCKKFSNSDMNAEIYSSEFFNTITCLGLPNRKLRFKVGVSVMLFRNIDQTRGFCNVTRL
ncbi:uncharacterized protein [Elaeis guineensis]|uniref:uncharacterized protein n=1 Tax=Elaeis guineensis var. tenera TaxID=51953 RepID=UPI003C6D4F8F